MPVGVVEDGRECGRLQQRATTTMSPAIAHDLSIQDLLCALNEKLSLEWTWMREIPSSRVISTAELEAEVSTRQPRQPILGPTDMAVGSDSSEPYRSKISKPERATF